MDEVLEREMTISHQDFFRLLPKAVSPHSYQVKDREIFVNLEEGEIIIQLSSESVRKIASLSLPVTHVRFFIKNVAKKTKKIFFTKFDRAYQKGGG